MSVDDIDCAGNILIVDDEPTNLQVLGTMLQESGYVIRPATNGRQALDAARLHAPDLILLDIMMPDMDGYEVCTELKADEMLRHIPVIFISALNEPFDKLRAFEVGAHDYVTKPFHVQEVIARVRVIIENARLRRRDRRHVEQLQQYIEQRDQAEKQLLELALEKGRVDVLTSFVSDVAHEFKTPLAVISTALYLLFQVEDKQKRDQQIARIEHSTHHITQLVNAMLDVVRMHSYEPNLTNAVDWNDIISTCVDEERDRLDANGFHLGLDLQSQLPTILGDSDSLKLAFQHVFDNAIKFNVPGGAIIISTRAAQQELIVTIADTGIGINPDDMPHIFKHFYRVDKARTTRGLGLGLAIVRKVLEYHQGRIEVTSEEGAGSQFSLIFPLA